jgi:alpha-L-fucosidase
MTLSLGREISTPERTREQNLKWWRESRFGMFVTWGLYAQLARGEWVMNRDRIPVEEYERLADTFRPVPNAPREWAKLASESGMKYMVLVTKHHEGFCLWDSKETDYNAVRRGPGRDLVREYVDACREFGLGVGIYYSLVDWHHPDGLAAASDPAARRRFLDFTQGCVRELMTNYGKIDVLWYDTPFPFPDADGWESEKMNAMARQLQPGILINDRSQLPEDFDTPEGHVAIARPGRDWEACMTLNGGEWGYTIRHPEDWLGPRAIIDMLRTATSGAGNLLLNIGPRPDGTVPDEYYERLPKIGRWLADNGDAVYGPVQRIKGQLESWVSNGFWTLKGNSAYLWIQRAYPSPMLRVAGMCSRLGSATLLGTGEKLAFTQRGREIDIRMPTKNPDPHVGVPVVKLTFDEPPLQRLGMYGRGESLTTI